MCLDTNLTSLVSAHPDFDTSEAIFIGGSDEDLEGTWSWLDYKVGTNENTASGHVTAVLTADWLQVWEYDNWQGDEPNGGEEENCLEMVGYAEGDKAAGWWNDIHCSHNKTRSYVCSYDNGTELIPICF